MPLVIDGLALDEGDEVQIEYNSTVTIYEHQVICTLEPGEFNWTTNPTLMNTGSFSSSVSGSGRLVDYYFSGSLNPYFTTVGLYNSFDELIAVAKTAIPIKRTPEVSQTVIVRFDF
jgi:hypothetical protein